jgi:hypothetical protein
MNGIYQGFGSPEGVWRYIYNSDIVGWTDADLRDLGNIFVSYKLPSVVIYIYIYMAYVQPAVSSDLIYESNMHVRHLDAAFGVVATTISTLRSTSRSSALRCTMYVPSVWFR